MAMDCQDGEELLEDESPLLTTIAIQFDGGLVIVAMRRLPGYVTLDRNLRFESTCSDIYSDELATRMLVNIFHPQNHQNMILDITYGISFAGFLYLSFLLYWWSKLWTCEPKPKPQFGPHPHSYYRYQEYYV